MNKTTITEGHIMARMTKDEFSDMVHHMLMTYGTHNHAVDIGGEGKVVVLRWALSGSAERTEKKVLLASQSPVMVKAAYDSFAEWFKEVYDDLQAHFADQQRAEQASENALSRQLEDSGWMDAAWQDEHEAKFAPLDPQSGVTL